ncbi:hypothetical protein, conserved, partial [Babesia bigemina]
MSHHVHLNSKSLEFARLINAITSLNHNNNLRALNDIDSKLISLGHLAGQLGGFVGESESVKKAVENAIIAQITSNEELKNDYSSLVTNLSVSVNSVGKADDTGEISELSERVTQQIKLFEDELSKHNNLNKDASPSSPSPSAELAKLHSKLEALKEVEKLCGFLTNSNKQQNNPTNNILTHLCDGLEKFLGFNKNSKGYDGTGIVYSDIDRLCDAVMGFLSGVLGAVKDENEVTTYDNYITGDDKKLKSVLKLVDSKIGSGRTGLAASVGAVKEWLEGYENTLTEKTSEVTKHLDTLINEIDSDINDVQGLSTYRLFQQYDSCSLIATRMTGHIHLAEKDLKNVDSEMGDKLAPSMKSLHQAVNNFKKSADNKDIEELNKFAGSELDTLRCSVEGKVTHRIISVRETLQTEFQQKIEDPIKKVKTKLTSVDEDLKTWIQAAKKLLQGAVTAAGDVNTDLDPL